MPCEDLIYCPPQAAVRLGGDSVVVASNMGIFLQPNADAAWEEVIYCYGWNEPPPERECLAKKPLTSLLMPDGIWVLPNDRETLVYDCGCPALYVFQIDTPEGSSVSLWSSMTEDVQDVNVQGQTVIGSVPRYTGKYGLLIWDAGAQEPRKAFRYPEGLARRLDSVGVGSGDKFCFPAFDPEGRCLWIAIYGYGYMYIADMDGHIRDSVAVRASDYKIAPEIKSRIKSDAVAREWLSQWTQIRRLRYVAPGYFLLQYDVGPVMIGATRIRSCGTAVWRTSGEEVSLSVPEHWQLAGVEADGEMIFVRYQSEEDRHGVELFMTRLKR